MAILRIYHSNPQYIHADTPLSLCNPLIHPGVRVDGMANNDNCTISETIRVQGKICWWKMVEQVHSTTVVDGH